MLATPPYISCEDSKYTFSKGLFNGSLFVGRPCILYVNGGVPPYTWTITGNAFTLAASITEEQYNELLSTDNTIVGESVEEVYVIDSCGTEISFYVNCCAKYLCCEELTDALSIDPIIETPTEYRTTVQCYGGCPPFRWQIFYNDYYIDFENRYTESRQNILIYKNAEPGSFLGTPYQVSDACGTVKQGHLGMYIDPTNYYRIYATGEGNSGQQGDNSTGDNAILTPIVDTYISPWAMISSNAATHVLGIREDGTLWGWGENGSQQLGLGDTTDRRVPTLISSDTDWIDCVAGGNSSYALKEDGSLYVVGNNTYGQLGLGDTTNRTVWTLVPTFRFSKIWTNGYHCVGRERSTQTYVWGYGGLGNLGLGAIYDTKTVPTPLEGSIISFAIDDAGCIGSPLTGSGGSTFIIKTGILYCTGDNASGQLGIGMKTGYIGDSGTYRTTFYTVGAGYEQLCSHGGDNMIVRTIGGALLITGYTYLGDGTEITTVNTFRDVLPGSIWTTFDSSGIHHIGIRAADGKAYGWGYNASWQLTNPGVNPITTITALQDDRIWNLCVANLNASYFGVLD